MGDIVSPDHLEAAGKIRSVLSTYKGVEDLIAIGAYVKGSNPKVDYALARLESCQTFLRQGRNEDAKWEETIRKLKTFLN
jgi:flagellum-specific ATP synthase